MSKLKKIMMYLGIVILDIVVFIAIIMISSKNQYPSSFLQGELSQLKSSLDISFIDEDTKNDIYSKIGEIENAIENEEEAIETSNKIRTLRQEIFYCEQNYIAQ